MKEWILHNNDSFTIELPKNWTCKQEPEGQLVLTDPSSSVTMTFEVAGPEFRLPANASKSVQTNADATTGVTSPRDAQSILQRWISRFANVRPLTPPRQILGSNHMTCAAEGLARTESTLGRIKDIIHRTTPDCWRFWAVFDSHRTILVRGVGACEAMQFLAPVLEAIICSVEIHPETPVADKPFIEMVVELGRQHIPPNEISAIDDDTLNLGGMKIRIDTLLQQYQQQPDKINDNVRSFFDKLLVRSAVESTAADDWEQLAPQVMPVLLPADVANRLNAQVIQEEWLAGMKIHYEIPGANVPIGRDDCRRWDIDAEELEQRAMSNLLRATRNMQMNGGQYERYTLFNFTRTNAFNSSRILLPILYGNLREHLGTTFYIGIPDRDVLLAFSTQDDGVLDWMRNQVRLKYSHATHPLSDRLFLATPDGIAEVDCEAATGQKAAG